MGLGGYGVRGSQKSGSTTVLQTKIGKNNTKTNTELPNSGPVRNNNFGILPDPPFCLAYIDCSIR